MPKNSDKASSRYQKLNQRDHILLRPDSYVGSIEKVTEKLWVVDKRGQFQCKDVRYVPALYKIFDEILVNASDNFVRDSSGMDTIRVDLDLDKGRISVMNNGKGIPIEQHKKHKMYIPEMVFGHLLTSDNYDDSQKKITGGRNGYGAKLTNIFSTKFKVETVNEDSGKKYVQEWSSNMKKANKPDITRNNGDEYTKVTFWPDLAKFGMKKFDEDIASLFRKRVYDIAGCTPHGDKHGIKTYLDGKKLEVRCFEDYIKMYTQSREMFYERINDRWEVGISFTDGDGFKQCSFANAINTIKGGSHVSVITDQITSAVLKRIGSKNKGGIDLKPIHIKNHLWVFVNALIENPSFDSQTKETLTTKTIKFGSSYDLRDSTIQKVVKSGVVDNILQFAQMRSKLDLGKKFRSGGGKNQRVLGIPKLEDANDAGGDHGKDCTLILTEGDSAKAFAVAGLSVVGRDRYGVFPLRGKLLNVRDASHQAIMGNAEIQNLIKIMGLDLKKDYETSIATLRYGSVMIMTDQDFDGSHIKGLLVNLFEYWWPNLAKRPGFLKEFVTPIVKVSKQGNTKAFFTVPEFEKFLKSASGAAGWKTKYYKGLGTSTSAEAREYFKNFAAHQLKFQYGNASADKESIDMAFNKKRADDRKDWINQYQEGEFVDHSKDKLLINDFINKELVLFAKYDVMRSIPSLVDGLKPTQRKVLFSCFKRNLKSDVKVAQLAGYISEHAGYHHGEMSLVSTIVGMAQDFVGSNNVNLLYPSGQFGTRSMGGKDAASARYIYTRLSEITRYIYHPHDDNIVDYLEDDGQKIEPRYYVPIIPMILVNGADGIGTGWSTSVPNFNPRDIIANIRRYIKGEPMQTMHPWYRGFTGDIEPNDKGGYDFVGRVAQTGRGYVEMTELPIRKWTLDYKEFLQEMLPAAKKDARDEGITIEDIKEYHTESTVHFVCKMSERALSCALDVGLERAFRTRQGRSTDNMMLFNSESKIQKYDTALNVMQEFCALRVLFYDRRKQYLLGKLTVEKLILENQCKFLDQVCKNKLKVAKKKKSVLINELNSKKFQTMEKIQKIGTKLFVDFCSDSVSVVFNSKHMDTILRSFSVCHNSVIQMFCQCYRRSYS